MYFLINHFASLNIRIKSVIFIYGHIMFISMFSLFVKYSSSHCHLTLSKAYETKISTIYYLFQYIFVLIFCLSSLIKAEILPYFPTAVPSFDMQIFIDIFLEPVLSFFSMPSDSITFFVYLELSYSVFLISFFYHEIFFQNFIY